MCSCLLPNPLWRTRVKPYAVCLFRGRSRKHFHYHKQHCCPLSSCGWGAAAPIQAQISPVRGISYPSEAKGAKEAINLLCFTVPTLKSKNDYMHNAHRIPKKEGSEKWKRKIRYRICCLYSCVITITTKVYYLKMQAKQYFCFRKLANLIPSPCVAQPGIFYYSLDLY